MVFVLEVALELLMILIPQLYDEGRFQIKKAIALSWVVCIMCFTGISYLNSEAFTASDVFQALLWSGVLALTCTIIILLMSLAKRKTNKSTD